MIRKHPGVDVIKDLLEITISAFPSSNFLKSLLFQYQERGGLSKKQLQDFYDKAMKVEGIPMGKMATLEAVILKKPTRYKSPMPVIVSVATKDESVGERLQEILDKYPEHKMVRFLKIKYDNNETLTAAQLAEMERFYKLLILKIK